MRKIAFVNEKGGSCKTTLSVNIGSYFAARGGKRVLIVDLDPQGQSGKSLGIDVKSAQVTTLELLMDPDVKVADAAMPTRIENLDIIVANKTLTDFPTQVADDENRNARLRDKLRGLRGYDYLIFDAPPSMGLITINIMLGAGEIIIPVNLTYLALDGCAEIVETVGAVKKNLGNRALQISLVLPVLYRNTRLANAILQKLSDFFGDKLSKNVLGYNVIVDEAQSYGKTVWEYAPNSRGAQVFEAIAKEIDALG
jgi:chromosome partitioning protein